jgi:hypothetical protein
MSPCDSILFHKDCEGIIRAHGDLMQRQVAHRDLEAKAVP